MELSSRDIVTEICESEWLDHCSGVRGREGERGDKGKVGIL